MSSLAGQTYFWSKRGTVMGHPTTASPNRSTRQRWVRNVDILALATTVDPKTTDAPTN